MVEQARNRTPSILVRQTVCQADLDNGFGARVMLVAIPKPAQIGLIEMNVLADVLTRYTSPIQEVREDLSEIVRIQPHAHTTYYLLVGTCSQWGALPTRRCHSSREVGPSWAGSRS